MGCAAGSGFGMWIEMGCEMGADVRWDVGCEMDVGWNGVRCRKGCGI